MSKGLGKLQRQLLAEMNATRLTVAAFKKVPNGLATVPFMTWALAHQIKAKSRAGVVATGRALRRLGEKGYVQGWHVPRIDAKGRPVAGNQFAWALTPAGEIEAKAKGQGAKMAFAENLMAAAAAYKL